MALNQGGRGVGECLGTRDPGQPGGVSLHQAADAGMKPKPSPTPVRGIPAGSHPVGAVQKCLRMPGCKCQPLRQALLLCQMGASLLTQAWGFPQSCWDPCELGEAGHPLHVWAARWLSLGCWAFLSHMLSLYGSSRSYILPGNLWWPCSPPAPHKTVSLPGGLSV